MRRHLQQALIRKIARRGKGKERQLEVRRVEHRLLSISKAPLRRPPPAVLVTHLRIAIPWDVW